MPALVAGIHAFDKRQDVDGRDKPGHDDQQLAQHIVHERLELREVLRHHADGG
jgi:hypothetical protein